MRVKRSIRCLTLLGVMAALAVPAAAQQGLLTGRVTDAASGLPVDAVQVQVLGGPQSTGGLSDVSGVYRVQLPAGTYSVVVERVGYRAERFVGIRVPGGQTTTLDITITSMALALDGVVITASRTAERQLESPATTHIVGSMEISERTTASPVDHLRTAPGVDIISSGIQSSNVVVRGFNNIFSGSLHALTDHRLAGVPSLRVNLLHFIPANNEDIDRMEVVLGPGSALYGPNTANGVLHILTKSPLDHQGTTFSVAGGERSVFQGQFRSAFLLSDNLGFKVSGQYLKGNEWEYTDPTEAAARATAQASPATCIAALRVRGFSDGASAESCARVGERDFDIKRYGVEARADYRFADDGTAVFTYGLTSGTGIELTGLGAGQTGDWRYSFMQARGNKGRLFGQVYFNASDAGDTFLLRDGVPLVDKSSLFVAQLRHGLLIRDRQDFTYGVDYVATRPDTEGTINGFYEDSDNMTEVGAYLQSKTALSQKVDLILAGRVDKHNMLPDPVYSPRAALVVKPTDGQSLRLTYNRAFSTPSSLNFFLDISGGAAPSPLGSLGYTVRAFGTGKNGYSFQNADGTLKGFRSPFNPGGRDQLLPASAATNFWGAAVQVAAQGAAARGTPLPASIVQLLASLQPTAAQLPLGLYDLNTLKVTPAASTTIPAVAGIRESYTESIEAGWQGIINNRLRLSADVYYEKKNDFVSPLVITTPLVTFDGQAIGAFITVPIVTALTQQFIAAGLPPAQAQQQAQAQAAVLIPQLATALAGVPVGVVSSPEVGARGADIIVTYMNVGDIDYWGADLGFSWFLDDKWTMNGTYSHVSEDYFKYGTNQYISLNAPKNKATLGLAYRNARSGFNAEGRVRYTAEFPAESAGYVGTKCLPDAPASIFQEDCVGAATLFDVNLGYQIPRSRATVQLAVTNLFNADYRSFVGVPNIGRFALVRLKYDL